LAPTAYCLCLLLLLTAALPALAQTPNLQVCANQGFSLVSAEDADGIKPITYEWYENGTPVLNSNTTSLSFSAGKATPGFYQYVRKASNAACSELPSNTYTVEVVATPAISITGGNASQTVTVNTAISPITYTASNATTIAVSSGSLPPGVSGSPSGASFTINGTPSATGTYNYSITANSAYGCQSSVVAGTITVDPCAATYPECSGFTTVHAQSSMGDHAYAVSYCSSLGEGWRLPTITELMCARENLLCLFSRLYDVYDIWTSSTINTSDTYIWYYTWLTPEPFASAMPEYSTATVFCFY
jgi:hypothetical protein